MAWMGVAERRPHPKGRRLSGLDGIEKQKCSITCDRSVRRGGTKAESVVGGNVSLVFVIGVQESVRRPYGVALLIESGCLY